jgi:TonB family protein
MIRLSLIAFVFVLFEAAVAGQESDSLFENARAAAAATTNKLLDAYSKDIEALVPMYQQSGDLNAKSAAENELERLRGAGGFSVRSPGPLPSGIAALKQDYSRRLNQEIIRVLHPMISKWKEEIERRKRDGDFATATQMERELDETRKAFGIHPVSATTVSKDFLSHPAPTYPLQARQQRLVGKGTYLLDVDYISGKVTNVTVEKSATHAILDNAALAALRTWKFQPHTVLEVEVPITFSIPGKKKK